MVVPSPRAEQFSISRAARECSDAFDELLLRAANEAQAAESTAFANQLDRFKLWAGNIGVFASTTASIDYRLKDQPELRTVVLTLLQRLQRILLSQPALDRSETLSVESKIEPITFDNAESTLTSSHSSSSSLQLSLDSEDDDSAGHRRPHPLAWHPDSLPLHGIQDTVSRLYRLSAMIRQPLRRTDKALVDQFTQKNPAAAREGAEIGDFARFKIRRLIPEDADVALNDVIVERLANAVDFRRRRFLYRHKHGRKLERRTSNFGDNVLPRLISHQPGLISDLPMTSAAPVANESASGMAKTKTFSKTLSQTVASVYSTGHQAHTPSVTSGWTTQSTARRRKHLDIPECPLRKAGALEIICPYCSVPLDTADLDGSRWRRHVLGDLSCYVCLVERCSSSDTLFETVGELFTHISWTHFLVWTCRAAEHASMTFESAKELETHLLSEHQDSFAVEQLESLVDQGAQPTLETFQSCPLCQDALLGDLTEESFRHTNAYRIQHEHSMQQHIAQHLEEIALLSLPPREDTGKKSSKETQNRASQGSARSTIEGAIQDLPDLDTWSTADISDPGLDADLPETDPIGLWDIQKHLCTICTKVDFDQLFNYPAQECHDECFRETLPVSQHNYGTLQELQNRSFSCPVCEFLINAWIKGARHPERVEPTDKLLMKRWRRRMESPIAWTNLYGVEMTGPSGSCVQFGPAGKEYDGIIVAFRPPVVTANGEMTMFRPYTDQERTTGTVDFTMIRSWLDSCQDHHPRCQVAAREGPGSAKERRLDDGELRLIDIHTRRVVRHEQQAYVALSYVCAQRGETPADATPPCGTTLPNHLPQTIVDALEATANLGERYLWIDAYCIDQSNEAEKDRLIGKMDLVYEGAKLTICALSGKTTGGMFGVSLPVERFDQVVQETAVGTFLTIQIPRLIDHINRSAWNGRGWTLQEAVISRRCLLFTPGGAALWCRSQVHHEAFEYRQPSAGASSMLGPRPYGIHISGLPFSFRIENESYRNRWLFETWNQIVYVYTSRSLTNPGDANKAIAGIFNRYSELTKIPITSGLPLSAGVCSLSWRISVYGSCTRREGFPSWSWLGWSDNRGMSYQYWITTYGATLPAPRLELELPKIGLSMWGRRDIGQDLIELRDEAQILSTFTSQLQLRVKRTFFQIRRVAHPQDYPSRAENQIWELLDGSGQVVPGINGRWILGDNHHQKLILPRSFPAGAEPLRCEFLCVQNWSEQHGPLAKPRFGDVVETIAISRTWKRGEVLRIGTVAIPARFWDAAGPEEIEVVLD